MFLTRFAHTRAHTRNCSAYSGDPVAQAETQVWADYYSNYIAPDEEPVEPMSDLIYPIVVPSSGNTNDDDVNVDIWMNRATEDQNNKNASTAVGLIVATLYWRDMIRNILPQGSNGIHIVFDVCGANWTYQINGPNVEYLGVGDWHDSRYQSLGIHSQQEFEFRDPLYSGAPIDTSYCNYTVHLYPSSVLKNAHTTNQPIVFTVVVLLVFVFTSVVFFVYDVMVERRQKSILSTAVRSSAIVSSLFPSAVRDRLFHSTAVANREEATSSPSKHQTQRFSILSPSSPIKQKAPIKKSWGVSDNTSLGILQSRHISEGIADAPEINDESRAFLLDGSPPIAELYPETTVLFADIAGFTNWSSSRQPTQVFRLLETLYAAFDEIAKQRKIFKIETIGDCYVAVVGLPTPRKDHAIVMVRFANDCIHRMKQVVNDLEPSLGQVRYIPTLHPSKDFNRKRTHASMLCSHFRSLSQKDTSALALRVGLNSGPTTAGVLRGEKSRFQLFGDVRFTVTIVH